MKKLIFLILLFFTNLIFAASATFTADTTTTYINPERGWYVPAQDSDMTTSNLLGFVSQYNTRLIFYRVALDAYQGTDTIPSSFITAVNSRFAQARAAGVKLIVIVNYDNQGTVPTTPVARMVLHAGQLKSLFASNRDIIAAFEGGFTGTYGEWSDPNFTPAMKLQLRDALLGTVNSSTGVVTPGMAPSEIPVSITNSYSQMAWFPIPLTRAGAFNGSPQAKMGWQNDCILSGNGDSHQFPGVFSATYGSSTYSQAQQRQYMQTITEFAPSISEPSVTSCNTPARTACTSAADDGSGQGGGSGIMIEGARTHMWAIHYPGESDNTTLLAAWKSGGCVNSSDPTTGTVANLQGYRFQLDSLSHADTVSRGSVLAITVNLHNYGWSRIFLERRIKVTLVKSGATDIVCTSSNDLRDLPSQSTTSAPQQVKCNIPSGATTGSYSMYLSMPDKNASLSTVRAYSIRPANANSGGQSWDDSLGRFATGTVVTVN